ncbi:MAG: hypothetical protein HOI47_23080 [Candidatus Scalindua sp.]|nr:hypothetical protein [Bacteroidota bacterium]MBT6229538.1 hypothetical protein [Candidatus Scalindua sp.]
MKVPAKPAPSSIVDVSIKHILIGFTILFVGTTVTISGIVILRDFAKYKRQQALLDGALKMIQTFKIYGEDNGEKR